MIFIKREMSDNNIIGIVNSYNVEAENLNIFPYFYNEKYAYLFFFKIDSKARDVYLKFKIDNKDKEIHLFINNNIIEKVECNDCNLDNFDIPKKLEVDINKRKSLAVEMFFSDEGFMNEVMDISEDEEVSMKCIKMGERLAEEFGKHSFYLSDDEFIEYLQIKLRLINERVLNCVK